jgi:hypothetical protein
VVAPRLHAARRHALGHARRDAHLLRAPHDLRRDARLLRRARARRRLAAACTHLTFETFIPRALQAGQPLTITIEIRKLTDERVVEARLVLLGTATRVHDHTIDVELPSTERDKLAPWIARGTSNPARGRPPLHFVDADRLIAWQLYWRGEQFWSGGEIWAYLPEMGTTFLKNENTELLKYLSDRTRAPLGRRYFVIGNAGQVQSLRGLLPTPHARDTFEIEDTTSNKFTLVSFEL